jgi:hypothetical protein
MLSTRIHAFADVASGCGSSSMAKQGLNCKRRADMDVKLCSGRMRKTTAGDWRAKLVRQPPGGLTRGKCRSLESLYLPSFFRLAQYAFIFRACAFLWAAVKVLRPFLTGVGAAAMLAAAFLGGRPRRLVGPCRASMARLKRSRSATSKAMIWSLGILGS